MLQSPGAFSARSYGDGEARAAWERGGDVYPFLVDLRSLGIATSHQSVDRVSWKCSRRSGQRGGRVL
jgi:hypothetical protein